jgi:hypothetical protein
MVFRAAEQPRGHIHWLPPPLGWCMTIQIDDVEDVQVSSLIGKQRELTFCSYHLRHFPLG